MINDVKHENTYIDILKCKSCKTTWRPSDVSDLETLNNLIAYAKEKVKSLKSTKLNITNPCDLEIFKASRLDKQFIKNIKTQKYDATAQNPLENVEEEESNFLWVKNQTNMFGTILKSKKKSQNIREMERDDFDFGQMVHTSCYHYSRKRRRKCLHWMYIVSLRRIVEIKFVVKEVRIEYREEYKFEALGESINEDIVRHTYLKTQTEKNNDDIIERFKCKPKILNVLNESKVDDESKIYKCSAQHSSKDIFGNNKKIIFDLKKHKYKGSVNTTSLADEKKHILPEYYFIDPVNKLIRLQNLKNQDPLSWLQKK